MFDPNAAYNFLLAIGAPDVVHQFRAIHDTNRTIAAIPIVGTITDCWQALDHWNGQGYGIFVVINETNGTGVSVGDVTRVRAQWADVDSDPNWDMWRALGAWECPPSFYVITSPGKFHAYWVVEPYAADAARFGEIQRRLVAKWRSDPAVVDLPRVMRLPGSANMKQPQSPAAVTLVPFSGTRYEVAALERALSAVVPVSLVTDTPLGAPEHAAPSFEWATIALNRIDPSQTDRGEWLKLSAAFKASTWQWGEAAARTVWDIWCAKYPTNNVGENAKLWRSITATKTGWSYLMRASGVAPEVQFGAVPTVTLSGSAPVHVNGAPALSAILTPEEQAQWFDGCILISSMGSILTPSGRFMEAGKFNATYGGKAFIINTTGTVTDEPWRAATRGQVYTIPKVDHIRFIPSVPAGTIITDELGRRGVNTYRPANIVETEGDAAPFINHLRALLPSEDDVTQYLCYLAHIKQRLGVKAFFASVIQSAEGAGKGIIKEAMTYALGSPYVHAPNAQELTESGGKFTAWLRNKLLIVADEIRTDDRRDMLEVLKPLITENRIEIQGKGADQTMEDNCANWLMFTNFKDAIPISRDSRRYAIYYSPLQSADDIVAHGMGGDYFPRLFRWLRGGGHAYVSYFLQHYEIDVRYDPAGNAHRAPVTSSTAEAIYNSYGRIEQTILMAVDESLPGFRNGWVSSYMLGKLLEAKKINAGPHILKRAFTTLGYHLIGRTGQIFMEDMRQPNVYNLNPKAIIGNYQIEQNYGSH